MKDRADAVIEAIKKSDTLFTAWDFICLSCIILINTAETTPQLKPSIARIVGTLIDGSIQADNMKNGILPIKGKPSDS